MKLSVEEDIPVYAVFGEKPNGAYTDPRHADMGWRVLYTKPENLPEQPFETWDKHRIRLGIPDGSRDMEIERSTLIECNIDRLHGVSFTKGCFVGQELTARMHNRGLAKRHLYPVAVTDPALKKGDDILVDGALAGTLRSRCGDVALASLKDELAGSLPLLGHHK